MHDASQSQLVYGYGSLAFCNRKPSIRNVLDNFTLQYTYLIITFMAISYRTGITILQIIYFVPALALALLLCVKQGLKQASSSWRFIVVLSLLRIAGDIAYFIALNHPTVAALVTVIICDLLGLAPLTLACVGLLGRV